HAKEDWMAVADLHFGFEVRRRAMGGLWPMWGMETIAERLESLVSDYRPETLVLVGDVVDSGHAPREAVTFLDTIADLGPELVLVEGNHDRGLVRRHRRWVDHWVTDSCFFHHGHLDSETFEQLRRAGKTEISGHQHPSINFGDGAGTSLRLPSLATEQLPSHARWTLPAFSPWAGGTRYEPDDIEHEVKLYACSRQRVFEAC
ncbi:MAG: metallophosphoesterase, partial [Verrucomicrobiota bacterium]